MTSKQGTRKYLAILALVFSASQSALAIDCGEEATPDALSSAISASYPDWYHNVPTQLRLLPADNIPTSRQCDFYRAANGLDGALCVDLAPESATTDAQVVNPAGSYGDNVVDRLVQLAPNPATGNYSCSAVASALASASTIDFVPVETNSQPGQVCVRDVMRLPSTVTASATVVGDDGAVSATNRLLNAGNGCFVIDDLRSPGDYMVRQFLVDTFSGAQRDLGLTANLAVGEHTGPSVWFVDNSATGRNLGTYTHPFESIGALNAAQGTVDGPQQGDAIFLYHPSHRSPSRSQPNYQGPLRLKDRQILVGQQQSLLPLLQELGISPPAGLSAENAPREFARPTIEVVGPSSGFAVPPQDTALVLARDNQLHGVTLACRNCTALYANNRGSLTTRDIALSGSVAAALFNTHLDVEVYSSFGSSTLAGPALWVENTSGRFELSGSTRLYANGRHYLNSDGASLRFRNTGEVTLRGIRSTTLWAESVADLTIINAEFNKTEVFNQRGRANVDLRDVQGSIYFGNVSIGESLFDAGPFRGLRISNTTGEASVVAELLDVIGNNSFIRGSIFDRLVSVSASGDARVDFSLERSRLINTRFNGLQCTSSQTARLGCHLAGVEIGTKARANAATGNQLIMELGGSPGAAPQLDYSVTDSRLYGTVKEVVNLRYLAPVGKVNGRFDNVDIRGLTHANGLYQSTQQGMKIFSKSYIDSRLAISDTQFRDFANLPALGFRGAGQHDISITDSAFYGEFSGFPIGIDYSNASKPDENFCLDLKDNVLVGWAPRDDAFVRLAHQGASDNGLLLPDYRGAPSGVDASQDILRYLNERGNRLYTFNSGVEPQVDAEQVTYVGGNAIECRTPLQRTFVTP